MKGHTTFTIAGRHPLLLLVRDYLIQEKKFALVPWSSNPDFCLYGAALSPDEALHDALHRAALEISQMDRIPTVILSSSSIPPVVTHADDRALFSLSVECMIGPRKNLIVRPYNVYGPDITTGVIPRFITAAKEGKPLPIRGNGYRTRCFVHQDDFLRDFGDLLGETGTHTIGTGDSISIIRLADSIWRAVHGPDVPTKTVTVPFPPQYDAMSKTPHESGREYMSLRKGVWLLLQ